MTIDPIIIKYYIIKVKIYRIEIYRIRDSDINNRHR